MGKNSHRTNRRNRAPRDVRYSTSGATRVDVYDDYKLVHCSPEFATRLDAYLERSAAEFETKFGRAVTGDDPVFWDRDADEPTPISPEVYTAALVSALRAAGIDEARVFACEVTGVIVTEENVSLLSPDDLDEWYTAIEFYDIYGPLARPLVGL